MFEYRRSSRREDSSPVTFVLDGRECDGQLVNLSATGALLRLADGEPIGPEAVGRSVTFTSWYDVGALLRPRTTAVRYFEEPSGKHLAVKYLPD